MVSDNPWITQSFVENDDISFNRICSVCRRTTDFLIATCATAKKKTIACKNTRMDLIYCTDTQIKGFWNKVQFQKHT